MTPEVVSKVLALFKERTDAENICKYFNNVLTAANEHRGGKYDKIARLINNTNIAYNCAEATPEIKAEIDKFYDYIFKITKEAWKNVCAAQLARLNELDNKLKEL